LQALGVGDLIEREQRVFRHPVLGGDRRRAVPADDAVREVHDVGAAYLVAAARQRDPEPLSDVDLVGVGDVVGGGDLLVGDEGAEHVARDGVQPVQRLHDVHGDAVRLAHAAVAAGAAAAKGDGHGGGGGDARGRGGGGRQAVGAEEVGERAGVEARGELAVGRGVGDRVPHGGAARGGARRAGEVGGRGGRGEEGEQRGGGCRDGQAGGGRRHGGCQLAAARREVDAGGGGGARHLSSERYKWLQSGLSPAIL
jgi:hypothetical protein